MVKRRKFTEMPMPDKIIAKINKWGRKNKQSGRTRFADRNNNEYDWNDENLIEDNAPEAEEVAPFPATPAETPGVDLEQDMTNVTPVVDDEEPRVAELADAAIANAGMTPRQNINIPGVREEIAGVWGDMSYVLTNENEIVADDEDEDDSSYHTADGEDDEDEAPELDG